MLEENKAIARRFLHMFEQGDPSVADEIVAADYYNHDSPNPELGREGVKAFVIGFKEGLPDAQVDIEYQVAEGDLVVGRYTWRGTHLGELLGIPATGKRVSYTATTTMRIADGKIHEIWLNWDQWGLMQQMGVIPEPEAMPAD